MGDVSHGKDGAVPEGSERHHDVSNTDEEAHAHSPTKSLESRTYPPPPPRALGPTNNLVLKKYSPNRSVRWIHHSVHATIL